MPTLLTPPVIHSLPVMPKAYDVRDTKLKGFMIRVHPTGSKVYYIETGRGKRKKLGEFPALSPSEARSLAVPTTTRSLTYIQFLEGVYTPWIEANLRSPYNTLTRLRVDFHSFHSLPLSKIDAELVERWKQRQKRKPSTINRSLDDLKSLLKRAVTWGYIQTCSVGAVKRARTDKNVSVRWLSSEEEKRLRGALRGFTGHIVPLVLLSLNTGMRRGELFDLQWQDIDMDRRLITIKGEHAKSGQTRHIPLNDEAFSVLSSWTRNSSYVFPGKYGGRLNNVQKSWTAVLREANIRGFRWHDLRHTFASKLAMAGVDLNTIRELLGHSSYALTLRYAHLSPEHKAEAVKLLNN